MLKRLSFRVTAEDIARGKPFRASLCPVALALSRRVGQNASVSQQEAGWSTSVAKVPPALASAIMAYDATGEMSPQRFHIRYKESAC